ncbi:MAG TPA: hypothetical protein PKO06_22695, partial [Candidatus Ozemobacteraceae bacterium]|nr:hypothetical protein [Candidatus Ozemobacteraceae bacterium]
YEVKAVRLPYRSIAKRTKKQSPRTGKVIPAMTGKPEPRENDLSNTRYLPRMVYDEVEPLPCQALHHAVRLGVPDVARSRSPPQKRNISEKGTSPTNQLYKFVFRQRGFTLSRVIIEEEDARAA